MHAKQQAQRCWILLGCLLTFVLLAAPAFAQKKKKGQEDTTPVIPASSISDNDQIEGATSEWLAGWQIGEISLMQKHSAEDAVFVSGGYEPPVVGWTNYVKAYQTQKQRMQMVSLNRFNTLARVKENSAVSSYQWQFAATVDGKQMWARGHTTLVWEKRAGKWLITHNHTSLVDQGTPQAPQAPTAKQP
jgi:ketosteroid isomerase-like protein